MAILDWDILGRYDLAVLTVYRYLVISTNRFVLDFFKRKKKRAVAISNCVGGLIGWCGCFPPPCSSCRVHQVADHVHPQMYQARGHSPVVSSVKNKSDENTEALEFCLFCCHWETVFPRRLSQQSACDLYLVTWVRDTREPLWESPQASCPVT